MGKSKSGFTIVELLIVIVIIAVLAAISVTAYTGIQQRANASSASSNAAQAAKKIQVYYAENEAYPSSLSAAGLGGMDGLQYAYNNISNPKTFCVTATTGSKSFTSSSGLTAPSEGGCPGHGIGGVAPITNLADNPSFESSTVGWTENGGMPIARTNEWSDSGSYSIRDNNTNGWSMQIRQTVDTPAVAGEVFSARATVRAGVNPQNMSIRLDWFNSSGSIISYAVDPDVSVAAGSNAVLQVNNRAAPAGTASVRIRVYSATSAVGTTMYLDSVMLTKSSSSYPFADGTTPNWVWNGVANNSTSTGPPV